MGFLSGKNAKVRFGGGSTTLRVRGWRAIPRCEALDVTNSESSGQGEYIAGIKDLDVTITADYYYGDNVYGTWSPGNTIATVKLYLDGTSGAHWDIPLLYIPDAPNESETRGKVTVTFNGKGMGAIVAPAS